MIKIGIIGHFAEGQEKYDGQTVSTRVWRSELKKRNDIVELHIVDTWNYKNRIIEVFVSTLDLLRQCSHIVFMLSGNGMSVMLPMLYYLNKYFKRNIYHRVIGGNLPNYVKEKPKWIKYLNSFQVNWVQSPKMVEELTCLGVVNSEFLENFRSAKPIEESELLKIHPNTLFCTFCRVSKAKGIGDAIEAISKVSKTEKGKDVELHIYGPIDPEYEKEFLSLLNEYNDTTKYMGCINSEDAVNTLKQYYFHLFPTTWGGEGFPGTLIDCYNAGLPTIATDWAYNSEYIKDGETGYLYNWKQPDMLKTKILQALGDSEEEHHKMRINNLREAEKYRSEIIMNKILKRMNIC